MELFKFRIKGDAGRKDRLIRIRKSIESNIKFEEDAMSKPLNASTLKRIYNIESLWIHEKAEIRRLGSANYSRELRMYSDMKERYDDMDSLRLQRGREKYHVIEKDGKIYAFSTTIELTNTDISMMLDEIEESLDKKKIFLGSDSNIREE